MYKYVINPQTNKKELVSSKQGKLIIKNFLYEYIHSIIQRGGSTQEEEIAALKAQLEQLRLDRQASHDRHEEEMEKLAKKHPDLKTTITTALEKELAPYFKAGQIEKAMQDLDDDEKECSICYQNNSHRIVCFPNEEGREQHYICMQDIFGLLQEARHDNEVRIENHTSSDSGFLLKCPFCEDSKGYFDIINILPALQSYLNLTSLHDKHFNVKMAQNQNVLHEFQQLNIESKIAMLKDKMDISETMELMEQLEHIKNLTIEIRKLSTQLSGLQKDSISIEVLTEDDSGTQGSATKDSGGAKATKETIGIKPPELRPSHSEIDRSDIRPYVVDILKQDIPTDDVVALIHEIEAALEGDKKELEALESEGTDEDIQRVTQHIQTKEREIKLLTIKITGREEKIESLTIIEDLQSKLEEYEVTLNQKIETLKNLIVHKAGIDVDLTIIEQIPGLKLIESSTNTSVLKLPSLLYDGALDFRDYFRKNIDILKFMINTFMGVSWGTKIENFIIDTNKTPDEITELRSNSTLDDVQKKSRLFLVEEFNDQHGNISIADYTMEGVICLNCGKQLVRGAACDHITCDKCGYEFCYWCGLPGSQSSYCGGIEFTQSTFSDGSDASILGGNIERVGDPFGFHKYLTHGDYDTSSLFCGTSNYSTNKIKMTKKIAATHRDEITITGLSNEALKNLIREQENLNIPFSVFYFRKWRELNLYNDVKQSTDFFVNVITRVHTILKSVIKAAHSLGLTRFPTHTISQQERVMIIKILYVKFGIIGLEWFAQWGDGFGKIFFSDRRWNYGGELGDGFVYWGENGIMRCDGEELSQDAKDGKTFIKYSKRISYDDFKLSPYTIFNVTLKMDDSDNLLLVTQKISGHYILNILRQNAQYATSMKELLSILEQLWDTDTSNLFPYYREDFDILNIKLSLIDLTQTVFGGDRDIIIDELILINPLENIFSGRLDNIRDPHISRRYDGRYYIHNGLDDWREDIYDLMTLTHKNVNLEMTYLAYKDKFTEMPIEGDQVLNAIGEFVRSFTFDETHDGDIFYIKQFLNYFLSELDISLNVVHILFKIKDAEIINGTDSIGYISNMIKIRDQEDNVFYDLSGEYCIFALDNRQEEQDFQDEDCHLPKALEIPIFKLTELTSDDIEFVITATEYSVLSNIDYPYTFTKGQNVRVKLPPSIVEEGFADNSTGIIIDHFIIGEDIYYDVSLDDIPVDHPAASAGPFRILEKDISSSSSEQNIFRILEIFCESERVKAIGRERAIKWEGNEDIVEEFTARIETEFEEIKLKITTAKERNDYTAAIENVQSYLNNIKDVHLWFYDIAHQAYISDTVFTQGDDIAEEPTAGYAYNDYADAIKQLKALEEQAKEDGGAQSKTMQPPPLSGISRARRFTDIDQEEEDLQLQLFRESTLEDMNIAETSLWLSRTLGMNEDEIAILRSNTGERIAEGMHLDIEIGPHEILDAMIQESGRDWDPEEQQREINRISNELHLASIHGVRIDYTSGTEAPQEVYTNIGVDLPRFFAETVPGEGGAAPIAEVVGETRTNTNEDGVVTERVWERTDLEPEVIDFTAALGYNFLDLVEAAHPDIDEDVIGEGGAAGDHALEPEAIDFTAALDLIEAAHTDTDEDEDEDVLGEGGATGDDQFGGLDEDGFLEWGRRRPDEDTDEY